MLTNKTILVTGGTGSLGHALTRLLLASHHPRRIIIFSRDELKQYDMRREIQDNRLDFFLGDVRDAARVQRAFEADVDVVIHCAALKQVPACEYNPSEAVKTNILGAMNVIDAAIVCNVERVVALSSDKACSPINCYGKTKAVSESLFVRGNAYAGHNQTRFSVVRYGNVIGSRGSVVPLFLQQRSVGVLTVTDRRMSRFFMRLERTEQDDTWTAPEFVLWALSMTKGGEIFVPRLPSAKMTDVASAVGPGCEIRETGIRPGEKIHEAMISVDESLSTVALDRAYVILPTAPSWPFAAPVGAVPVPAGFSYTSDQETSPVRYVEAV
jgi:UDP-N-acetylglucosamine 4,6-dehydratase